MSTKPEALPIVAYWIPKAEQFCFPPKSGARPFARAWEPLTDHAQATAQLAALQAEVERLRADAERYLWLRHRIGGSHTFNGKQCFAFPTGFQLPPVGNIFQGSVAQHLDAAIDQARLALKVGSDTLKGESSGNPN
jgi:hypothetical protein